jgi:RNA polymerase sigma-70 factor, ECF subfamily
MTEGEWLAERFEEHRAHLRRVAYRMLGTVDESEDAVQEAWLRLSRVDSSEIENLAGWLTTVVARVSLDLLRARRVRNEQSIDSTDAWLPDPIVSADAQTDPEQEALLADSVSVALLVVLENLAPAERVAFVLHDMFAIPFDEIGGIVGRSPDAARQLASRARRRVRGARPEPYTDLAEHKRVIEAFLAASREGDFDRLVAVLDPDVVLRTDHALPRGAPGELHGAQEVANNAMRFAALAPLAKPVLVNGLPGFYVAPQGNLFAIGTFTVANGLITEIDIVADPEKLARIELG